MEARWCLFSPAAAAAAAVGFYLYHLAVYQVSRSKHIPGSRCGTRQERHPTIAPEYIYFVTSGRYVAEWCVLHQRPTRAVGCWYIPRGTP